MLSPIEILLAIEDIKTLKARYFRVMDTKDWANLGSIFAPDAVFDLREVDSMRHPVTREWTPAPGGDESIFVGRQVIVGMIRDSIKDLYTVHHAHMPEIRIISTTSATGIWPMQDVLRRATGELLLQGSGYYDETYENVGAGWQIKTSRLSRLYIEGALHAGSRSAAD